MSMIKLTFTILVVAATLPLSAQGDPREKVAKPEKQKDTSHIIFPGKHIFRNKFGISEDELIKNEGKPMGYLQLNARTSVMIYGKDFGFVFRDNKLAGIRITQSLFDWKLANQSKQNWKYSMNDWVLNNGIRHDMTLEDLKKILGDKLKKDDFRSSYEERDCKIEINFSTYTSGAQAGVKKVNGIYLMQKN